MIKEAEMQIEKEAKKNSLGNMLREAQTMGVLKHRSDEADPDKISIQSDNDDD